MSAPAKFFMVLSLVCGGALALLLLAVLLASFWHLGVIPFTMFVLFITALGSFVLSEVL